MGADRNQYTNQLAEQARIACIALPHLPATRRQFDRISVQAAAIELVICTATALEVIEAGAEWAPTETALCRLYTAWCAYWGVNLGSADEHINDPALPMELRDWLHAFSELWQQAEDREFNPRPGDHHA